MKYVFYEIKKLLSTRYVVYCILSLFILNVLVCTYQIRNDYDITAHKYANPLFDSYLEAPESVTSEYEDIVEFNNEQNKIAREQIQAGNYAWTPQTLPNKYAPDEYTDLQLFNLTRLGQLFYI